MRRHVLAFSVLAALCAAEAEAQSGAANPAADPDWAACRAGAAPPKEIVAACSRALAAGNLISKDAARAHNQRGRMLARLNEDAEALADFNAAIELAPGEPWAYLLRGNHFRKHNDLDRSDADYAEAIRRDPRYAAAYHNRGVNRYDRGQFDQAIADFSTAITVKPDYAEAFNDRGRARSAEGQYERALEDYQAAIRLAPNEALYYNNRGTAYRKLDAYARAIVDFEAALRLDPDLLIARFNRAMALTEADRLDEALAGFDEVLRREPRHDEAARWRGYVHLYLGRHGEAAAELVRALKRHPGDNYLALWAHIARKLAGDAAADDLAKDLEAAEKRAWPSPANLLFLGRIAPDELIGLARHRDAETERQQLCEAYGFAGAWHLIGGERAKAAQMFRKAVELRNPTYIGYLYSRSELKRLEGH